jgi:hypothetical protein
VVDKHQIIEEPCEAKVSRTVLKTSGTGDSLAEFNITDKLLPERPYRYEPRLKKQRPKPYGWMQQPRDFLKSQKSVA